MKALSENHGGRICRTQSGTAGDGMMLDLACGWLSFVGG